MKLKYAIYGLFILLLSSSISQSATHLEQNSLQIKGSDTMVNLGQAWAEE